ncbi:MAG: glycoside hydrolase family 13 protein [Anaerolineales bacterium]|nr:glycoside hydrolase family 13 protein [Anaerolineales bacterium]MDW8227538.1 glycoside hydrolase family 13 protein [Anaerolineales bacterium]
MTPPYWLQDAIFYHIFPDRFANGDRENDPPNVQKWGSPPTIWGFQGGDLRGILQHFDYLLDLGINAIYLNPIFAAPSTHRYNVSDYFKIDPKLGTLEDFHALVETAHRNGVRIILDGVFNHCGRGFFAFVDVLENGEHSPYKEWFHIKRFPLDAYGPGEAQNYLAWWNYKSLPKFNIAHPPVRKYLLSVARYWIEQGADGWRLDVPNEIEEDSFWAEFRRVVRSANRDACLIGEIWDVNPRWVDDRHFDSLMNYPVREALLAFFQEREDAHQFSERIQTLFRAYRRENLYAMYVPLDSHDTERFKTAVGGDIEKLKLAFLFQMAFPGAPAIYYGDEIGLEGGKDPDNRRAFPWHESVWDQDLRQWVKTLIALRKRYPSLRRGDFIPLLAENRLYAFGRQLGEERVLAVLNASSHARRIEIPCETLGWENGRMVHGLIDRQSYVVMDNKITLHLPAWQGTWLG